MCNTNKKKSGSRYQDDDEKEKSRNGDERERGKLLSGAVLKKLATTGEDDKSDFSVAQHR